MLSPVTQSSAGIASAPSVAHILDCNYLLFLPQDPKKSGHFLAAPSSLLSSAAHLGSQPLAETRCSYNDLICLCRPASMCSLGPALSLAFHYNIVDDAFFLISISLSLCSFSFSLPLSFPTNKAEILLARNKLHMFKGAIWIFLLYVYNQETIITARTMDISITPTNLPCAFCTLQVCLFSDSHAPLVPTSLKSKKPFVWQMLSSHP